MARIRACREDELANGAILRLESSEPIALYRVDDGFYATSDTCTHGQSSLSEEGELDGFAIECGWHFGRFDIRTGAVISSPCTHALRSYPVIVEQGEVFVDTGD